MRNAFINNKLVDDENTKTLSSKLVAKSWAGHPHLAIYQNNLGLAWHSKDEYDKAIEYFKQALDSDWETLGETHPSVARVNSMLDNLDTIEFVFGSR